MSECDKKCKDCTVDRMLKEIVQANFTCGDGPLNLHRGFRALVVKAREAELWERLNDDIGILLPLVTDARDSLLKGNPASALSAMNVAEKFLEDLKSG